MIRALALLLALATPALAQDVPPPTPLAPAPAAPKPATVKVRMVTTQGPIVLEIEKERAPITAANFLRYVDAKRLDNITFYRAVKVQDGYGLLQGGLRNDPKRVYPNIAHEPTTKTGLSHVDGAISMARAAPGSASADFFIVEGGFPTMDADLKQPGDNLGFAVFGHVSEGMDLVKAMMKQPVSATAGPEAMRGTMLETPIKILTVRREP